jgi:integration host factor subunit alpha
MTALTKAEMAERLYEELGLNKREAKELVELFFEEIRQALELNEQVKLSGFGNFDLRDKRQRPGRNPKTGEEIPITARRVVTFRPGQKLKARVEAYAGTKSGRWRDLERWWETDLKLVERMLSGECVCMHAHP